MRTAARVQLRSWTCSVATAQPDTREQSARLVSVCSSLQNALHGIKIGDIIKWLFLRNILLPLTQRHLYSSISRYFYIVTFL